MSDRAFVDTNVLIYLFGDEPDKQQRASELLISAPPDTTFVARDGRPARLGRTRYAERSVCSTIS